MVETLNGSICLICGTNMGGDSICGQCHFDHLAGEFIGGATEPALKKLQRIRGESAVEIHRRPAADGDDVFCSDYGNGLHDDQ